MFKNPMDVESTTLLDVTSVSTSWTDYWFDIPDLTINGSWTKYWIGFETSGVTADGSNRIDIARGTSQFQVDGIKVRTATIGGSDGGSDFEPWFRLYGSVADSGVSDTLLRSLGVGQRFRLKGSKK